MHLSFRAPHLVGLLLLAALSGCIGDPDASDVGAESDLLPDLAPIFDAPLIFDDVRSGGEPVIAILPSGTILVSSHPGWTHLHPKDMATAATDLVAPANLQSYLWRSTDNGTTWHHVDLFAAVPNLPRSAALGVSDPEFTVLADGTVCMTDLIGLASSSVSCSSDDGQTWLIGNSLASGGPNDRQWLASTGQELYFTANYFADHRILASNDDGLTWERRGDVPCSQDLVSNPHTGHLLVGCRDGIAVSEDAGFTWDVRPVTGHTLGGPRIMVEPAVDAAGNTWMAFQIDEHNVYVAGSPDEGLTWPWFFDVAPAFTAFAAANPHEADVSGNGTYVWPWISAGSEGRMAVTWIGSYIHEASDVQAGPWYIFTAYIMDAHLPTAAILVDSLTPEPMHLQPICQAGTACQAISVTGNPSGDRRLGDFFETTIDAQGHLHAVWANTAHEPDDVVAHVQYARQSGGIPLLAAEDVGVFHPTQG